MTTTKNLLAAFVFLLASALNSQEQNTKEKRSIKTKKIEQNKFPVFFYEYYPIYIWDSLKIKGINSQTDIDIYMSMII